jgi:hypothetical protein
MCPSEGRLQLSAPYFALPFASSQRSHLRYQNFLTSSKVSSGQPYNRKRLMSVIIEIITLGKPS